MAPDRSFINGSTLAYKLFRVNDAARISCLVLVLLTLAAYANCVNNGFVWDDEFLIVENPLIRSFGNLWISFASDLYQSNSNYYRPLQSAVNTFDYFLWGMHPSGFHLTNIVLHIAVVLLYFLLIMRLTGDPRPAFAAAALYAVHPANVPVAAYVAGRADSLAAVFMLLSLNQFLSHMGSESAGESVGRYILSLSAYCAALLSKEMAVILPALIILLRGFFVSGEEADRSRQRIKFHYISWYVIITAVYISLRVYALNFSDADIFRSPANLYLRMLTAAQALFVYLGIIFAPVRLYMERSIPFASGFWDGWAPLAAIGILLIILLSIRIGRYSRRALYGILFFFAALLPVSNIIPMNFNIAEHWLYLPSMGIFLACGVLGIRLWDRNKRSRALLMLVFIFFLALYSGRTVVRNTDWRDGKAIFTDALKNNPLSVKALNNLGNIYHKEGRYREAMRLHRKAVLICPKEYRSRLNLGLDYEAMGMPEKALSEYLISAHLKPDYPKAHFKAGQTLEKMGNIGGAIAEYLLTIRYHDRHIEARAALGNIYLDRGMFDEAEKEFTQVIAIAPWLAGPYNNLGNTYSAKGQYKKAEELYRKAFGIEPGNADYRYNLALVYIKEEDWGAAIPAFKDALILRPRWFEARLNLGSAYYSAGEPRLAEEEWEKALRIRPGDAAAERLLGVLVGRGRPGENRKHEKGY